MNTIEKLAAYRSALLKWKEKKRRFDLAAESGKPEKKPLEIEPLPTTFEIGANEIEWAEKIRREVLKPVPPMVNLDNGLKSRIPARIKI